MRALIKDRAVRSYAIYGTGDYGLNFYWQGAGFFLFFYLTNVAGLPSGAVGTLLFAVAVVEAAFDPFVGYFAERTHSRMGPYRPYMLWGALPLGLSFAGLFSLASLLEAPAHLWLVGVLLLAFRLLYGLVSIPYAALGARVTRDFDGRTRLAGIRMGMGFLGGLSISFLGGELQIHLPDQTAFLWLGLITALVATLAIYACSIGTTDQHKAREEARPRHTRPPLVLAARALWQNTPFLQVLLGLTLITIATTMVAQTMLYFFETNLGDRALGNRALQVMAAAPMITIPLWSLATLKIGKKQAWIVASVLGALGTFMLFHVSSISNGMALISVGVTVAGLSGYAVIYWAILPDTIEHGAVRSGIHSEALLIGVASSVQKISGGLAAFVLGLVLESVSYKPGEENSAEAMNAIKWIFTALPGICLLASALIMVGYSIDRTRHNRDLQALARKQHASPKGDIQ